MRQEIVGDNINKVDAIDKVTGQAVFATDYYFDEMLYLKILRAPHPHALIKALDTSKAEKLAGVEMVITADDFPELKKFGLIKEDQEVFVTEKTRFMGDPLALVVAENKEIASKALDLIEVDYEPLEIIEDPKRALEDGVVKIHDDGNLLCSHKLEKGDIEAGFAAADLIIKNQFKSQCIEQLPLQPEAGVAKYDEQTGVYTIWAATQWLHDSQADIASSLGVSQDRVELIQPAIGGAFGKREDLSVQIYLALAAKLTGKAVKLTYTREESMIAQSKRHPITFDFKTGVRKDGYLTAWQAEIVGDAGAYASSSPAVVHQALYHCTGPYNVANVKGQSYAVYTNNTYSGAMRGFGATQAAFAYESQMDSIAKELGFDPIELKLKNAYEIGSTTPNGQRLDSSVGLKETIKQAKKASNYNNLKSNDEKEVKKRGTGVASIFFGNAYGEGFPDHSICELKLKDDGTIAVKTAAADVGQGVLTVVTQIVAQTLNVAVEDIKLAEGNTAKMKNAGSTSASRQTIFSGNAAKIAAEDLLGKINHLVFLELGLNYPEFELKAGKIIAEDRVVTFKGLVKLAKARDFKLESEGCYFPKTYAPTESGFSKLNYVSYSFNTQIAEVEVNTKTGEVDVLKITAAPDVGKAIHPQNVEGQSEGGTMMGLGMALMEEQIIEKGITKNPNLSGYLVPTAKDMPELETVIVESGGGAGPYGAKGIGEPAMLPTAPAIINAIEDAVGVRIKELPATPEKILAALEKKK